MHWKGPRGRGVPATPGRVKAMERSGCWNPSSGKESGDVSFFEARFVVFAATASDAVPFGGGHWGDDDDEVGY